MNDTEAGVFGLMFEFKEKRHNQSRHPEAERSEAEGSLIEKTLRILRYFKDFGKPRA